LATIRDNGPGGQPNSRSKMSTNRTNVIIRASGMPYRRSTGGWSRLSGHGLMRGVSRSLEEVEIFLAGHQQIAGGRDDRGRAQALAVGLEQHAALAGRVILGQFEALG